MTGVGGHFHDAVNAQCHQVHSGNGEAMHQMDLLATEAARALLDQLLADSRLYRTGKDYRALLDFVIRLRNFAPFNAMLLQVQKPGLMYAASRLDWLERFNRTVKDGARPLLILWPFGPVALVYDVADTQGAPCQTVSRLLLPTAQWTPPPWRATPQKWLRSTSHGMRWMRATAARDPSR